MEKILQKDDKLLRKKAEVVNILEIQTEKIKNIISQMKSAMMSQKDGIAIAAPQIGQSLQIFMISGERLLQADKNYKGDASDLIFINPKIIKTSKKKMVMEEGCLSVRWLYGKVKRATRITVEAYNEKGQCFQRGAGGILAQILQHECDHLNGILFTDITDDVWEMTDEEIKELQNPNAKS